jgi:uncharacterized membrane protein
VKTAWRMEAVLLVIVATMFAGAFVVWPQAPDQIPMHWNLHGEVDGYGGKFEGLLGLPCLALGIYLAMRFLPRIDPGRANYARFGTPYTVIRAGIIGVMAAIYAVVLVWTMGVRIDVALVVPVIVGTLFVVFGGVLGKIRPNWFVGIRTPWTMSSKQSWVRTHRLGGWLFMALGVLFIGTGLSKISALAYFSFGGILIVVVTLFGYSYIVWRNDPEKLAAVGTQPADDE